MPRLAPRVALASCLALLALAGCRTRPAPAPGSVIGPGADAPWSLQRAALRNLDRYSLDGRTAVAANGQGFSAGLRYQQQADRSDLALDGPLGIGGMRMEFSAGDLKVTNSRGQELDGVAARQEIEERLGFELPLAKLRWWLLGIPAPGDAQLEQDPVTGEIRGFRQEGWSVRVEQRMPALGFSLPRRLVVDREGARLKLLAESWR
jgi:outer membrane lipoprotein LolB